MGRFELRDVRNLDDRIRSIQELVWEGLQDSEMRALALKITSGCQARDEFCELHAIFDYNQRRIRYTGDIAGLDTFSSWKRSLEFGGGDCDDACIANATALAHNGFGVVARLTASEPGAESPEHIYAVAIVPKEGPSVGVALDTTLPGGNLGDEPPQIARFWDFPLVMP